MLPSKWEECRRRHLLAYVYAIHARRKELFIFDKKSGKRVAANPMELSAAQLGLLQALIGINHFQLQRISGEQLSHLLNEEKLLNFFFDTLYLENEVKTIRPNFPLFGQKLYGPVNSFHSLSFAEWGMAENAWAKFNQSDDTMHLAELASILYRPKATITTPSEKRIEFNMNLADKYHQAIFRHISTATLLLIHLWFDHCNIQLRYSFPEIYRTPEIEYMPEADETQPAPAVRSNWVDIALSLTDSAHFNMIAQMPVLVIFKQMQRNIIENDKLKKAAKS